jgi:uncharacterized membrane protein YbaN (DUF454 family)
VAEVKKSGVNQRKIRSSGYFWLVVQQRFSETLAEWKSRQSIAEAKRQRVAEASFCG